MFKWNDLWRMNLTMVVHFRSEGGPGAPRDVGSKRLQQTQAQVDEVFINILHFLYRESSINLLKTTKDLWFLLLRYNFSYIIHVYYLRICENWNGVSRQDNHVLIYQEKFRTCYIFDLTFCAFTWWRFWILTYLTFCTFSLFQVVDIMRVNVDKVLERDQKISELDDRAGKVMNSIFQGENNS